RTGLMQGESRRGWIAFYAPMKPPGHPVPSGDREIARLTIRAVEHAGWEVRTVSELRLLEKTGEPEAQAALVAAAEAETMRLLRDLAETPPALWFTYHCYYKAPDLLGPAVSEALRVPYVISEPSIAPRRRTGAWSGFAKASEEAIAAADLLLWTTGRDRPALEDGGHGARMAHLTAFIDVGAAVPHRPANRPARLLTVAMMRSGDKLESYRRLSAALSVVAGDWHLDVIGDGPARAEVEAMFANHTDRVTFRGAIEDRALLRQHYESADLFVWPGVGEGVGMVYLEAQAAGLPVVAEDHPAQRDVVAARLAVPGDPAALADAVTQTIAAREALGVEARAHVETRHSLNVAAQTLRTHFDAVLSRETK
ncbi:MAG: glycosyltransferase family 4 protein, partial [Pseudomonadota bacterium]